MSKVELNKEELAQFRQFQEHHELITAIIDRGIANIRGGKAIVHIDKTGQLKGIQVEYWTYRK